MPKMTYTGRKRGEVRIGPRVYTLKQGTFDAHPADVASLERLGATVKDENGGSTAGTGDTQE